jgi:hypothetical protein
MKDKIKNDKNKDKPKLITKKKRGRSPLYLEWVQGRGLELIQDWVRNGATEKDIFENKVHVSGETWYRWKKEFPNFSYALKSSKEVVDAEVESALYKKATGFVVKVNKVYKCKKVYWDEKGRRCEEEILKTAEEDQYIPPETLAQIFWLKNRKPEQWREKRTVEANVNMLNDNFIDALSNLAPNIKSENEVEE